MKMKRKFGFATLAATLAGTGIMGGLMATPVIADPANPTNNTKGTISYYEEDFDPTLVITKCIPTGAGTDITSIGQDRTYTFDFTALENVTVNNGGGSDPQQGGTGVPATLTSLKGPDIASVSATVNPATAKTKEQNANAGLTGTNTTRKTSDTTSDYYRAESGDWLDAAQFENLAEGVYVYEIKENATYTPSFTSTTLDQVAVGEYAETLKRSEAVYRAYIYVKPRATASAGKTSYIWAVTVAKVVDDGGTEIPVDEIKKYNPATGGDGELSTVEFNNEFVRQQKTGDDNPKLKPYSLSKEVIGLDDTSPDPYSLSRNMVLYGSETQSDFATTRGAKAEKFDFTLKLTRADHDTTASYNAYIYTSENGTKWNKDATPVVFTFQKDTVTGKYVATKTITLAHYQCLAFEDNLAVGTGYEVEEADYLSTASTNSGYKFTPYVNDKTTSKKSDSGQVVDSAVKAKSEFYNDAESGTTPAGILTNYLPFFIIIGGAIAGAVAIAVAKGKRRNNTVQ